MKVFISWSGTLSHQVALALRDWLPNVLQVVEPYVSSEDIDKGARWSTDISQELEESSFGVICVTPENLEAAWVNFEAGALSKSLERSRVAPFLFDVDRTAVRGPLLQFQSTVVEHDDVKKLVVSINRACENAALEEGRLEDIFEVWWPRLAERLHALKSTSTPGPSGPDRSPEDVLAEVLELARGQQKLISNPEALLPPSYVEMVFDRVRNDKRGAPPADHPVYRDLERRLEALIDVARDQDAPREVVVEAAESLRMPIEYILGRVRRRRIRPFDPE